MIILYNILQIILLPIFFLPLTVLILLTPKYRLRTLQRLGMGLQSGAAKKEKTTIWIHATSVGEVTSALPLVSGLCQEMPEVTLVFSASSKTGAEVAERLMKDKVDQLIPFPLDILPVINRFLRLVQPDLFILVETDFWPNIIARMRQQRIPTLLVNGRISEKSMRSYQRFSFFFRPLFASFHTLSMQTEKDRQNLIKLGVAQDQIQTLGNLKLDTALYSVSEKNQPISFTLPAHQHLFVAGSTHEGEEKILLQSYLQLKKEHPHLYLVIAPRDIRQGKTIQALAATMNLAANCRSQINAGGKDLFILDTIGELNSIYSHADFAFVGGSLVEKGGHNPIEPAIFSIPVLYGPHMEDFSEISDELLRAKGSIIVQDQQGLTANLLALLKDVQLLQKTGNAARICITEQQGVIKRHIRLIKEML
jgi:3-deoxy-D-manno-octulosonic-acid transferase